MNRKIAMKEAKRYVEIVALGTLISLRIPQRLLPLNVELSIKLPMLLL